MFDQYGFGNDRAQSARPRQTNDSDDRMDEKDDDLAHFGMLPNSASRWFWHLEFAMDIQIERVLDRKDAYR